MLLDNIDLHDADHIRGCRIWARRMVWIYFILIFAEGILRKWLLPQFSAPLAVVRDPFLLLALFLAMRGQFFPWNSFTISLSFIAIASFGMGLIPEDSGLLVDLNGLRTDFLHFFLVFLMPVVLEREDVDKMARICIWLLPLIAGLMVYQFHSPPNSWINASTGLGGSQLGGTVGNIRPPSIFPFITGVSEYGTMVTAFLLVSFVGQLKISPVAMMLGIIGLIVAVAHSISRLMLASVILVILAFVIASLIRPNMVSHIFTLAIVGFAALFVMIQLGVLEKSVNAFSERIELASSNEGGSGGIISRITEDFTDPITQWANMSIDGVGLGRLTNAGTLLVEGNLKIKVENELSRVLLEGGLLLGPAFIIWRFCLFSHLIFISFRLMQWGEPLPWLLLPIAGQLVLIGQLGRPTTLGFTAFTAGYALTIVHLFYQKHFGAPETK